MRLVQVTIPTGKREAVLDAIEDEGIDAVVTDETSGREYTAVAYFPVPKNAVEPVLEKLRQAGIDEDAYTVVLDANTVISRRFEELQERYTHTDEEDRIAREELTVNARAMAPPMATYAMMTVLSAVIATAGLLLDSPAVVVGSMVIAPLVGPAMSTAVGTVVDERAIFRRGVRLQVIGLLLSIVSAAVFAFLVRTIHLVPPLENVASVGQIRERVAPDFLSLVVALGAGVAGVVSLSSGVSTALVGVMIAVALIPPAATVGIGLAWGRPMVSLGSGILLLVNVLSINLAALVTLWYMGYRPQRWFRADDTRTTTLKRISYLLAAIVVLSVFLGGVTLDSLQRAETEQAINDAVENVVVEERGLTLISVEVEQTNTPIFQEPDRVVVVVGIPTDQQTPDIASQIGGRVQDAAGENVTTQVQYLSVDQG